MKKQIFKLALGLAVVVVAGYTAYISQASSEISGVTMDNVEALASGEVSPDCVFSLKYICVTSNGDHRFYRKVN